MAKKNDEYKETSRFIIILCVIGILTFFIIGYLFYNEMRLKKTYMEHPYNPDQTIPRIYGGEIVTEDGKKVSWAKDKGDFESNREYCGDIDRFKQIIKSESFGIERGYRSKMVGMDEHYFYGTEKAGETIHLTVSNKLQTKAAELIESRWPNHEAAVVAMDPKTGAILCAYSHAEPGKGDPNKNSAMIVSKEDYGYAPGSTMKTFWAAVSLEEGLELTDFNARGSYAGVGNSVTPPATVNVEQALKYSVNKYFAYLAEQKLGEELMRKYAKKVFIGVPLQIDGIDTASYAKFTKDDGVVDLPRIGIGQGDMGVSALHMAMISSVIANDGTLMKPYIVAKRTRYNGDVAYEHEPEVQEEIFSKESTDRVKNGMISVVNESGGTGTKARIPGITVAGKTGTAEVAGGNSTRFIGFAPAENPKIAIAVFLEKTGSSGGEAAAPIASELMRYWLTECNP